MLTELEILNIAIAKLQREIAAEQAANPQADRWCDPLGRDNGRDVHRGGADLDALQTRLDALLAQQSAMIWRLENPQEG